MKRIAIFASGSGTNFEHLVGACRSGDIPAEAVLLVCDRPGARVNERADRLGVPRLTLSPRDFASKAAYEEAIVERLRAERIDWICLAGYMRIVTEVLLEPYAGRIINIHPSLLPAFKGAHAIRDAFDYGVKVFGVTVHRVDASLDGGPIVAQRAFPYEGSDFDELERRVHATEYPLYAEAMRRLIAEEEACKHE